MRKVIFLFCFGVGLLSGWSDRGGCCHAASPERRTALEEQLKPRWQVGQRWVVETTTTTVQVANARPARAGHPVRWQFTVLRREDVGGRDCFRVEITCRSVEGVPGITIWVDEKTLALRQAETGLLVQGEVRRVKERYDAEGPGGSPVIGLPSALPLDLPVFSSRSPRSGRFGYRALMIDEDDKPADDLAFAVEVEQSLSSARPVDVRCLLDDDGKSDRKTPEMYDVRLRSNGREVRQLWKTGLPWPSYSSSGGTTSRLVHVAAVIPMARTPETRSTRPAPTARRSVASASMDASGMDEGRSRFVPWSGYWWKAKDGGLLRPLRKYDLLTGRQSVAWEARAKDPKTSPAWSGYCHAWAAASVMEREPRKPRTVSMRSGRSAALSVGDQKAFLTILHDQDESVSYGERYNGGAEDDPQDIYPDQLWKCLRLYVKQRGIPLIVDIDPGVQVWNYPVFRYRVTHRPHTTAGVRIGTMEIWMADDMVPRDFIGTKVKKKTYQFTFRMNGKALVMGSGRWYGASRKDHPDFAWYPTMVRPKNPHIKTATVRRMLGSGSSSVAARRTPERPADLLQVRAGRDLLGRASMAGTPELEER